MADLFGFGSQNIKSPLTADKATITWNGSQVTGAIQLSISYAQSIQRRRTLGNKDAVIFAAMPQGQISIARLMTTDSSSLFAGSGWRACDPGTLTLTLAGGCNSAVGLSLTATACVVSQFSIQAEAEGLTVIDNMVIEFMQLSQ